MNKRRVVFTILLLCLILPSTSFAQKSRKTKNSVRINSAKPSVYVTFLRFGKRQPVNTGESDERIWLRLHNNTRWSLRLQARGAQGQAFARGDEEEVGLFVSVEEVERPRERWTIATSPYDDPPPPPPGSSREMSTQNQPSVTAKIEEVEHCAAPYRDGCHVCSGIVVRPGRSIVFSVPREMLCKDRKIFVVYNYGWEDTGDSVRESEAEHRVYFHGSDLPKRSK